MATYSHSKLSSYETCPLQYRFRYIDKVKVEKAGSVEAFLGSVVHETLEELYRLVRNRRVLGLEETLADFDARWEKAWSDDIRIHDQALTAANYRDVGRDCIAKFHRRHHPFNSGVVLGIEKPINQKLDEGHGLSGYIDRLMQAAEGVFEIHDYKTSQHLATQAEADADRQLGLYDIAVRREFPDAREVRLVWHYLRFDRQVVSARTDAQRGQLLADTLQLIRKIEAATEFPAQESSLCDWCDYYEICPAKGHRIMTGALPPNRFLEEPGVELVNRLARLKAGLKQATARAEAEIAEVEGALLAYAEKNKVEVIVGSTHEVQVRHETKTGFPGKNDEGREELEAVIRKAGRWDEVSDLNTSQLKKAPEDSDWPEGLAGEVRKFEAAETTTSVKLRKRRDAGEDR